jgi:hypothetical protein
MILHRVTNFCVPVMGWSNRMPTGHFVTHKDLQKFNYTIKIFLGRNIYSLLQCSYYIKVTGTTL